MNSSIGIERKSDAMELTRHIYSKYSHIRNNFPMWQILSFIDRNSNKIIVYRDKHDELVGAGMFLTLTDESLLNIINERKLTENRDIAREFLKEEGNNIHFVFVVADSAKTILSGLRFIIKEKNPDTVSWYNPEGKLTFIQRNKICQQYRP